MNNFTLWISVAVIAVLSCSSPFKSTAGEPFDCDLFDAAIIKENTYIVVGDRGRIFLSVDSGMTFRKVHSQTLSPLSAVDFPDASNGWIIGESGVILHSNNGGVTWQPQVSGVNTYLMAVDFYDDIHGCVVGENSTVLYTSDGGHTWTHSLFDLAEDMGGSYNLFAVKMTGTSSLCITGDMGRIFISQDAGMTWTESKSPVYDDLMMDGRTLYAMDESAGVLYAAGIDGTMVYSSDKGETWTIADSGSRGPEYFCIAFAGKTAIAAGSGGYIIQTENRGDIWKNIQVPKKIFRSWLSGIGLKKNACGDIKGLVVGQHGTVGIINNSRIIWR